MNQSIPQAMTTEEALAYFDTLDPVALDEMTGTWRGEEITTGHYLDGTLEAARWLGKNFDGPDAVHPLVHERLFGGTFCVNPALLPLTLAKVLPAPLFFVRLLFPILSPFVATKQPKACLRMMMYRGKLSATMIYDAKPIHDVFRRIDDASVMGLMDQRGDSAPFFFKLTRVL